MLRYSDGPTGRTLLIEVVKHHGGRQQYFTFRLLDGVPRSVSDPYPFYLDAVRAALEAARQECRKPTH